MYKKGGLAIKFDTFDGNMGKHKALIFIEQFVAAFACGNL